MNPPSKRLQPKAIIFDLGSTLIEYEPIPWDQLSVMCSESAHQFLTRQGHNVGEADEFVARFEVSKEYVRSARESAGKEWTLVEAARHLLNDLTINHDERLLQQFFDASYTPVAERLFVYDDTLDTLRRLKLRYGTLGLISNTIFPARAHLDELERFGIAPFLSFTVFSSEFGYKKPHPSIFEHAASLAQCSPESCVYVGDRYLEDVYGPSQVGMSAILKLTPNRDYPQELLPAIRQINHLSELNKHLVF